MEVVQRLGYTPNASARSLITNRTLTVGGVGVDPQGILIAAKAVSSA